MNKQKTIILLMGGTSGINASLALSKRLAERGHHILYLGLGRFGDLAERQGFTYHTFDPPPFGQPEKTPKGLWGRIAQLRFAVRQRIAVRDNIYDQAERWLKEVQPDLVLLDSNLYKYAVPFLKNNVPIINVSTNLAFFYSPGRPPVFSSLFPAGGHWSLSALQGRFAWIGLIADQRFQEFRERVTLQWGFGARQFESTAALVRALGGVLKRNEYYRRLVGPEIVLGPKSFDFPAAKNTSPRCYAGICVDESRTEVDLDDSFLNDRKPLIYCAMGSAAHRYKYVGNLYRALFEGMTQLPGHQLVLQVHGPSNPSGYPNIPSNVRIFTRTPQLSLLRRSSVFITHGGFSSIREGILYGVPMLVFPGRHDQPGNAARVVYYGLGDRGNMKTVTGSSLLAMIRQVQGSDRIRTAIGEMQKRLREEGELTNAVQFIERFIHRPSAVKANPVG